MTSTSLLPDQRESVNTKTLKHADGLYRHAKRHEWGLALLAWEEGGRRAYQFDDGKLRVFKAGYYSLMESVETAERLENVVMNDLRLTMDNNRAKSGKTLEPVCPLSAQIGAFVAQFPQGFLDDAWVAKHRRRDSGRGLKRHHGMSSRRAQQRLSAPYCDLVFNEGRPEALHAEVIELLAGTELVMAKHVNALKAFDHDQQVAFATSLRALLHGDGEHGQRFHAYVRTLRRLLGERPSWRLATSLPALVHPEEHVCIRYTTFIRQAASIEPTGTYTKRPRRRSYASFLAVAKTVRTGLEEAGHDPRDLLDVHDFIWETLRPAALKRYAD